jgi:hypothetical protein
VSGAAWWDAVDRCAREIVHFLTVSVVRSRQLNTRPFGGGSKAHLTKSTVFCYTALLWLPINSSYIAPLDWEASLHILGDQT